MKRILLGLSILAIAGATTFVACKKGEESNNPSKVSKTSTKNLSRESFSYDLYQSAFTETTNPITSNAAINDIVNTALVSSTLSAEGFSINTLGVYSTLTDAANSNSIYCVELTNQSSNVNGGGLIIYTLNAAKKIYLVYITKVVTEGGVNSRLIKSISSNQPYINLDPTIGDPASMPVATKEQRAKFKGCVSAAWNDLNDNLIHSIGCNTVYAPLCITACIASCAHHLVSGFPAVDPCYSLTTELDAMYCLCSLGLIDCTILPPSTSTSGYSFPTY